MSCNNCEKCKCKKPKYASVTKVLNETKSWQDREALENWKIRVGEEEANRISEEAKERGRRLDDNFEKYHQTGSCEDLALTNFLLNYQIKDREMNIVCDQLELIGRADAVLQDQEGQIILIDFKTSKKVKQRKHIEDYFLQVGAYFLMIEVNESHKIDKAKIVIFIGDQFTPQVFRLNKKQLEGYALKFMQRYEQYKHEQKQKQINDYEQNESC